MEDSQLALAALVVTFVGGGAVFVAERPRGDVPRDKGGDVRWYPLER